MIGARDVEGRERLLRYVARPMVAGERVSELADGRIAWRRSIPGGRGETHRINGAQGRERDEKPVGAKSSGRIDWATLMQRVWGWDVLACPRCDGRMRFIAVMPRAESRWPRGVAVDHDSEGGSRTASVDRLPVTRG